MFHKNERIGDTLNITFIKWNSINKGKKIIYTSNSTTTYSYNPNKDVFKKETTVEEENKLQNILKKHLNQIFKNVKGSGNELSKHDNNIYLLSIQYNNNNRTTFELKIKFDNKKEAEDIYKLIKNKIFAKKRHINMATDNKLAKKYHKNVA